MFTEKQKENIKYFEENLEEFLKDDLLKGKYIVIHDKEIKNSFDTFEATLKYAIENYRKDELIIQQVISKNDYINYLKSAI